MKAYAIELPDDTVEALKKHWKIEDNQVRNMLQELVTLYIVEQEIHPTELTCKAKGGK